MPIVRNDLLIKSIFHSLLHMQKETLTPAAVLGKGIRTRQLIPIATGGMIGAGWMVMIGSWLQTAGSLGAALAFLTGLLLILPVALCYARLAARFPQSGGEIVYVYEAFGTPMAFAVGWLYLWISLGWSAFQIVVAAWFVNQLIPAFSNHIVYTFLDYEISTGYLIVAVLGTFAFTRVNYRGGGASARVQECLTITLIIGIVGIFIAGLSNGSVANMDPIWSEKPGLGGGFIALLITVPLWYAGFSAMAQVLGEIKQLELRHISWIMIGTLVGLFVFYICAIFTVAYSTAPEKLMLISPPLLAMFEPEFVWGIRIIYLLGLLGVLTTLNILFFIATRLIFALSRAYMLPLKFSIVHSKYGSPQVAVLFVGFCTLVGAFTGRGALALVVNTSGMCYAIIYLLVALAYVRLARVSGRRNEFIQSHGILTGQIAVICTVCMVLFALLVTFQTSSYIVSLGSAVLGVWILLGAIVWRLMRSHRASVSELQRREIIHTR